MNLNKTTSTFSLFVLLSRVLGYKRDFFIAIYLGSGPLADAFFVAFRIPNTFRRLFSEGTFNAAFVPSYSSELLKGKGRANLFANTIFGFTPFYASILSCLCIAFFAVFYQFLNLPQGFSISNTQPNQYLSESEQNISPHSKNIDLDRSLMVESKMDTLEDKKEKEKANNSKKIKFVNY